MADPIKGEKGIVYIWDGTLYRPVACLTGNSLNTVVSIIENTTKCDPGVVTRQAGTFSYTLDMDGQYIDTTTVGGETTKASHDYLLTKQMLLAPIDWKLDTGVAGATGIKYYGTAIISDLTLDQQAGDEISTFSCTFNGTGDIAVADPHATP